MIPKHVTRTHATTPIPDGRTLPGGRLSVASAALALTALTATAASLPEPDTVLYGKIVDRSGAGQDFQATSGTLLYTIVDERDGSQLTLETTLAPLSGGLSYRTAIPHEAVARGLSASTGAVPLDPNGSVFRIASVHLDGSPARILPPASNAITASQLQRAAAHRFDLEITLDLADSDGDGIPDWWEDRHGLDSADRSDAGADNDGDGTTNFAEFLAGSDPTHSDISPSLDDTQLIVYPDKLSGIYFAATDANTPPRSLRYTLVTPPATGTIYQRSEANPTQQPGLTALAAGTTFSGADLETGRIVYQSGTADPSPTAFTVTVDDRTPGHEPSTANVTLLPFEPGSLPPQPDHAGVLRDYLSRSATSLETTIWDLELLSVPASVSPASSPPDSPVPAAHVFVGTSASDHFTGAGGNDYFYGGYGDDAFTGGDGADTFGIVAASGHTGDDTITDFNPARGDVIDLRFALANTSHKLASYVRLSPAGAGWRLELDSDGDGSGFTDGSLTFAGFDSPPTPSTLWTAGTLLVPAGVFPETTLSFDLADTAASENGPAAATITVHRSGDLAQPLAVPLRITGSATNGVDYASIPNILTFEPLQTTATLTVEPFADQQAEATEIVDIEFLPSAGYTLPGAGSRVRIQITDLLPQLHVEIIEPVAVQSPRRAATIVVHRSGALSNTVLARLELGGTATPGTDYVAPQRLLNFAQGSTSQTIFIEPADDADLSSPKTVHLSLLPDQSYIVTGQSAAQVSLVQQLVSFASWRDTHFPETAGETTLDRFADTRLANGLTALQAYAFGILPNTPNPAAFSPLRITRDSDNSILLDYHSPPTVTGVRFRLEASDSSAPAWQPATPSLERLWPEAAPADLVRFRAAPAAAPQRLFRLVVSRP